MRYTLVAVGTYGDVVPFAAVGRQLEQQGHEVTLLANEKFRGIGDLPFEAHSSLEDYERGVTSPDVWTPGISAIAAFEYFGKPAAERISKHVASTDSIVMASPLAPTAFAEGRQRCISLCPWPAWREMAEALPQLPTGYGLWPEWFAEGWGKITPTHFPVLEDDDYEPDAELAKFLRFAPAVVTFGSGSKFAGDRLPAALEALASVGQPALVLGGEPREWPTGVLHRPFVPLRWLLPQCHSIIHHGGIGTVAAALETATPQIILPIAHDHFFNAERVEALHAGVEVLDLNSLRKVLHENQTRH